MTTIHDILPKDLPIPTCLTGEDLDSRREYEWFKDVDHLLSLTIYQSSQKVIWSAALPDEDAHGSFLIENGWPEYMSIIIKRIKS